MKEERIFTIYTLRIGFQVQGMVAELGELRPTADSDYFNTAYFAKSEPELFQKLKEVIVKKIKLNDESVFNKPHPKPDGYKRAYLAVTKYDIEADKEVTDV